jgi:hypothetical protein
VFFERFRSPAVRSIKRFYVQHFALNKKFLKKKWRKRREELRKWRDGSPVMKVERWKYWNDRTGIMRGEGWH